MKRILLSVLAVLLMFGLASCGNKKAKPQEVKTEVSAVGYGIVHKEYVGFVTVTAEKTTKIDDGKLTETLALKSIVYDEAFMPYHWAQVTSEVTEGDENVIEVGGKNYAKYVSINGIVFTASEWEGTTVALNGTTQKVKYSATGIDNLYYYLAKSEVNCQWYVEAVKANKVFACNATGTKLAATYVLNATYNDPSMLKSAGNYWKGVKNEDGVVTTLGWKANVEAFAAAVMANKFAVNPGMTEGAHYDTTKPEGTKKNYVSFGNAVSSATFSDYMDYYRIAQNAWLKLQ